MRLAGIDQSLSLESPVFAMFVARLSILSLRGGAHGYLLDALHVYLNHRRNMVD